MTAALAIGSSFGIKVHGFSPRELAIGAEGEHEEWVQEAASLRVSNVDGLKCFASLSSRSTLTQSFPDEINRAIRAISSISLSSTDSDIISTCPQVSGSEWLLIWGGEAGHNVNELNC